MPTHTTTPPRETYETLRAEIARRHPRFSDRLRQIAEFALDHPRDALAPSRWSPSALASSRRRSWGSPAHRVWRFTEMQQALRSRLV
jgi:hypothetical protein